MPNGNGPHSSGNKKTIKVIPQGLTAAHIIGYTATLPGKPQPSIYFKQGHFTIVHESWNVGWDDCEEWTPLFFGNVDKTKRGLLHCHDANGTPTLSPQALLRTAEQGGYNRVGAGVWDLSARSDTQNHILFEFWVRRSASDLPNFMNATNWQGKDWFSHPSRSPFYIANADEKEYLWRKLPNKNPAAPLPSGQRLSANFLKRVN